MLHIFHAIALHIRCLLLPATAQQYFLDLHVSSKHCTHNHGVISTDARSYSVSVNGSVYNNYLEYWLL
jgi:hypothetical protein